MHIFHNVDNVSSQLNKDFPATYWFLVEIINSSFVPSAT